MNQTEDLIAVADLVVYDKQLGIDRKIVAGAPVPKDLEHAYKVATGEVAAEPGDDGASIVHAADDQVAASENGHPGHSELPTGSEQAIARAEERTADVEAEEAARAEEAAAAAAAQADAEAAAAKKSAAKRTK